MLRSSQTGGAVGGLLLLAALAAALAWGLFGWRELPPAWRVERTRSADGSRTRLATPIGGLEIKRHDLDAAKLGVPVYPGAELVDRRRLAATIEFESRRRRAGVTVVAAVYRTVDDPEKVRQFYRDELPHWMVTPDGIELVGEGYRRMILLRRESGGTVIAVASIGEPASN